MRCQIWLLAGVCLLDSGCSWGGPKEDNFYPLVHRGFDQVDRYGAVRISYHDNPALGFDFSNGMAAYSSDRGAMYFIEVDSREERQIYQPEAVEYQFRVGPALSGKRVFSRGSDSPDVVTNLYMTSLEKRSSSVLTIFCSEPSRIDGGKDAIVYNARCPPIDQNDQYNIEVFYLNAGGIVKRLTEQRDGQYSPRLYDNWVVWEDYRKGFCKEEIVLYDLKTAQSRQLTDDDIGQFRPDVDGDLVVWTDLRNGTTYPNCSYENSDIYLYRISNGELRRLTTDPHDQEYAVVSGKYVAWTDYRYGSRDPSGVPIQSHVFVHNLETGEEKQVTFGEGFVECCPKISGDRLVYLSYATGGWGALWMVDLKKYWPE